MFSDTHPSEIEIDSREFCLRRCVLLKHFGARCGLPLGRSRGTSSRDFYGSGRFLDTLLERVPFPVRALQVDGGSEFAAEFEEACQRKQFPLFVLPPKSPKLNGHVEHSHRTHHEEFYQLQSE